MKILVTARALLATFLLLLGSFAQAADVTVPSPSTTMGLPQSSIQYSLTNPAPSAPPSLFTKPAPNTFQCLRMYTYQGKTYSCDSNLRSDGEKLRPMLEESPEAANLLDKYQASQQSLKTTAYVGTAGLILLIAGAVSGSPNAFLRGSLLFGGLIVMEESFRYGYLERQRNEAVLGDAVQTYNRANPDKTIQLKFSTGVNF